MKRQIKTKTALMLCACTQSSHLVLTSSIAKMADTFPDAATASVQIVSSIPSLMVIPFALLSGWLTSFFSKRLIILFSLICIMVGGLLPLFFHDTLGILMLFSMIVGMGVGLISPVLTSLIVDHFSGNERVRLFGFQGTALCVGGILMISLGGLFADGAWYNVYLVYLLILPVFVAAALLLPRNSRTVLTRDVKRPKIRLNTTVVKLGITFMLFSFFFNTFGMNSALYISEAGNNSTALAGIINAVSLVGGFLLGLIFRPLSSKLKRMTIPFGFVLCGSTIALVVTNHFAVLVLVSMMVGASIGVMTSQGSKVISSVLANDMVALGSGLFISFNHIGLFTSPLVIAAISEAFNGYTASARMGYSGGLALLVALLLAVNILFVSRSKRGTVKDPWDTGQIVERAMEEPIEYS